MIKRRRPRQADVAKLANVSPAIVSMVLNNRRDSSARMSAETEKRVWEAVRTLGYVPNPVARSLASGQNRMLGVFTYEAIFPLEQRNFYYPFLIGIEQEAEDQGYDLILFTSATGKGRSRRIYQDQVNRLQLADGAILLGQGEDKDELKRLLEDGFPFVFVGRREMPGIDVAYAAASYAKATEEVVTHLVELGHRRIGYLGALGEREATQDREEGFRRAHISLGLKVDSSLVIRPAQVSPSLLSHLLDAGVTAFAVEDDLLAHDLVAAATELGRRVPQDFSFALLGDPLNPSEAQPDWTTFKIPRLEMGRQAVRLLLQQLAAPDLEPQRFTLPCVFVPGLTTAPPALRHEKSS